MRAEITRSVPQDAPAFFFVDIQKAELDRFKSTISSLPGVTDIETVPSLRGPVTRVNGVPSDQVDATDDAAWVLRGDRGLTYTADFPEGNRLVAGEWWPADYAGPPLVSLDAEIAEGLGLGLGDSITVSVLGVEVTATIANLRAVDWDSLGFNFVLLFAPGALDDAPHTHMATVKVASADEERAVFARAAADFPTVSAVRMKEVLTEVSRLLTQVSVAVRVMAAVTIFAGIMVLVGAVVAGRQAKTYDSVLLKVLGATRGQVLRALLVEYALLGLVTAVLAVVMGLGAGWFVVTQILNLSWYWPLGLVTATVVLGAAATLALGLAGTWSALSARPNQVLRTA